MEYVVMENGKGGGERWDMKCKNTCKYLSAMILSIQTLQDIFVSRVYNWWRFCECDIGAFPNWKLYKSFGDSVTNTRDSFLWDIVKAIISLIKMHWND